MKTQLLILAAALTISSFSVEVRPVVTGGGGVDPGGIAGVVTGGPEKVVGPGVGPVKVTGAIGGGDSSRAFSFLDSVFNRPECAFLTAEPDIPADLQSVLIRFNNAISANRQWFLQFKEANGGQGPLPYDEHFGITRAEYARVQHLEQFPPRMIVLDSQRVALHRQQDHIQLEGDSSARILNYLEIYTKARKIIFAGDTLNFVGEMDAPPSSPFGQWHGFVWRLERTDVQATLQSNQITARVIEVDAGLPARSDGRVFLRIKYQDVQQGVDRADMDLTGYIR